MCCYVDLFKTTHSRNEYSLDSLQLYVQMDHTSSEVRVWCPFSPTEYTETAAH